ncbi:MAG: OmpA family protein [Desulfobacteraceae bacterium]|nr:OmpA family protein [Desulfobacteraceae bacterium]
MKFFLKISLFAIFFMGIFVLSAHSKNSLTLPQTSKEKLVRSADEYNRHLVLTREEALALKQDLNWLVLKINRLRSLDYVVPKNLYQSVEFKKSRMNALEKDIHHYEGRLEKLNRKIQALEAIIVLDLAKNDFKTQLEDRIRHSRIADWFDQVKIKENGFYMIKTILPILFPSGSSEVAAQYDPFLKDLATLLKEDANRVFVSGHTDSDPIHTKKYPSNFELGAARAANVVHKLTAYGVPPSAFQIVSTGEYRLNSKRPSIQKAFDRYVDLEIFFIPPF